MKKANIKPDAEIRRIYRKAKTIDMEKYEEAKKREHDTMIRSRQIAANLGLQMKIGDVEYQGDGNKAIFYYIADERVDFRQLIKVLAETFRVRIEMKQIGARQEAGRIGGIGPCGRELCCATWMTNFISVSTSAARFQDISLNPQKLAGQCAKLKCCLNYEVDAYVECQKRLPSKEIVLETQDATYYYFKADILKGTITYSTDKNFLSNEITIPARRAFEVINMNRNGEKPEKLNAEGESTSNNSKDLLEQESVTRFDKTRNGKNKNKKKNGESKNAAPNKNVNNKKDETKNTSTNAQTRNDSNNTPNEKGQKQNKNRERANEKRNGKAPQTTNEKPQDDRIKENKPAKNNRSRQNKHNKKDNTNNNRTNNDPKEQTETNSN